MIQGDTNVGTGPYSLSQVSLKERKQVADDLRPVWEAATEAAALQALTTFEKHWNASYPSIARSWRANWDRIAPFYGFTPEIRRAIYTTNAIESLNFQLRKSIKTRGHFPNDEAVFKLMYLALDRASKKWTMPIRDWKRALQQFAILFEGRVTL
jgi:putative transposase